MRNKIKLIKLLLVAFPLLLAGRVNGETVAPMNAEPKPEPEVTAVEVDNSDNAFATDLNTAESLLRSMARQKIMSQKQSDVFVAKEMQKVIKFNAFSSQMMAHSTELIKKMSNPDGMIADGRGMVERDSASWKGYDYLASGSFMKQDVEKAIENYTLAQKYAPDLQKDWYKFMLGGCERARGDQTAALKLFDEVIAGNENWIAIKNAYLTASLMLIGKDNDKAVDYFEKGGKLCYPGEKAGLSRLCAKFSSLQKKPEACLN